MGNVKQAEALNYHILRELVISGAVLMSQSICLLRQMTLKIKHKQQKPVCSHMKTKFELHDPPLPARRRHPGQRGDGGGHDLNREGNTYGWRRDDTAFGICGEYTRCWNLAGSLNGFLVATATCFLFTAQQFSIPSRGFVGD